MKVSKISFWWSCIMMCSNFIDACHYVGHTEETTTASSRDKRAVSVSSSSVLSVGNDNSLAEDQRTSILNFFPQCLRNLDPEEDTDFDDLVKFIIDYTSWFTTSDLTNCSKESGSDTVECWKSRLDELLVENSTALLAARWCVNDYRYLDGDITKQAKYQIVKSSSDDSRENNRQCPTRTKESFNTCINNYFSGQDERNPIKNFISVLTFLDQKIKCSSCDCNNVLDSKDDFMKYYEQNQLTCDSCWPSRAAALVKATSIFGNPLKACSNTLDDSVEPMPIIHYRS